MSETFDPYHRWLGIPAEEQPPHHYRLLGIAPFESDREVIDSVAMRHIGFLQEITDAAHVKHAQRLLNELAAARRCLLDPNRKAAYDAGLRIRLDESVPAPPPLVRQPLQADQTSAAKHADPVVFPPLVQAPSPAAPGKTATAVASRAKTRSAGNGSARGHSARFHSTSDVKRSWLAEPSGCSRYCCWSRGSPAAVGRRRGQRPRWFRSRISQRCAKVSRRGTAQAGSLRYEGAEPRGALEPRPPRRRSLIAAGAGCVRHRATGGTGCPVPRWTIRSRRLLTAILPLRHHGSSTD
jgi:hypothetical protein